jgi:large subunit ribosomal protein L18
MQHQRQVLRQRERRAIRVRNRVKRDASRPRLVIFRSHQNIYAQIIDDAAGKTLVSASSRDQALRGDLRYGGNKTAAIAVGKALAQRAMESGVQAVVFDRREYKYHGRVAALAEAAREAGLKF